MGFLYYLLEVSFLSFVFYGFYYLLFRKETFFHTNRYLLLSSLLVSFLLPIISIPINTVSGSATILPGINDLVNLSGPGNVSGTAIPWGISGQTLLLWIYFSGFVFMITRSLYHTLYLSLIRYRNPSVRKGKFRVIMTNKIPSFSFFRWVFIQKDPESNDQQEVVLKHELAHSRQLHSADLIFLELTQALLWFNPLIQLYKRSVHETHEYLADRDVLQSGTNLRDYVDTIVEEIMHNHSYRLASHLKSSTLKKRVIMATKQSSKRASWKYLLIIPALVFGLLSFSFTSNSDVDQDKVKKNIPTTWPINKSDVKKLSQNFGGADAETHPGIDFAAKTGTPVMATASGIVKAAKEKGDYGNLVYIIHDDSFSTLYAHLDKIKVKEGDKVKQGQVIGTVGNTGKSTAPHLHYEVRLDGEPINPKKLMTSEKMVKK